MRWTMLILNVLAALAFVFGASMLAAAHRTHAYSTYRELVYNRALVDNPTYTNGEPLDVEALIRGLGAVRSLSFLGYLGAGACLLNGFVFFVSHRPRRHENAAESAAPNGGSAASVDNSRLTEGPPSVS